MADPLTVATPPVDEADIEMEVAAADVEEEEVADIEAIEAIEAAARVSFLEYLKSPIVQLSVGTGAEMTILTAHQDLLTQSPFFEQACAELSDSNRTILLPEEDLDATGSFVEYLYRGDYFPRSINGVIERDPTIPAIDSDGAYLLKHARVYTLAEKFNVPALRSLAHKKIQGTTSTARGEIAYARYVYGTTNPTDITIRRPVAAFWATRSHTLRHEAEHEFRAMCLEFPQFGFDVLSMVLDQKEKRTGGGRESTTGVSVGVDTPGTAGRGRKRARV